MIILCCWFVVDDWDIWEVLNGMCRVIVCLLNVLFICGFVVLGFVCLNVFVFSGLSFEKIMCNKGFIEEIVLYNWLKVWF